MRMHWSMALLASLGMATLVTAADTGFGGATTRPTVPGLRAEHTWALPAGFEAKDLNDAKDIKNTLAKTTDAALTNDGFDNIIGYLADNDRDRLKDWKDKNFQDLNDRVGKITQAWREKYKQDFDSSKHDAVVFNEIKKILDHAFRRHLSDGYEGNIHVVVVSRAFDSMNERAKHDFLWRIIDQTPLREAEKQLISLVYPVSPAEIK